MAINTNYNSFTTFIKFTTCLIVSISVEKSESFLKEFSESLRIVVNPIFIAHIKNFPSTKIIK